MVSDDYTAAKAELEETLRRLAPALVGREGALLSEWTLIIATTDVTDGESLLDIVAPDTALISHRLGALRFAQVALEHSLRDG